MDIDAAYKLVMQDEPQLLDNEARQWEDMPTALEHQAAELKGNIDSIDAGVDSTSGRAYMDALKRRQQKIVIASTVAKTNATSWSRVADLVRTNQKTITDTYNEWLKTKSTAKASGADEATARVPFDQVADFTMRSTVLAAVGQSANMKPPETYEPMPNLGSEDSMTGFSGGSGPNGSGSVPSGGGGPGGSASGGSGPRPGGFDNGGHLSSGGGTLKPQLQGPSLGPTAPTAPVTSGPSLPPPTAPGLTGPPVVVPPGGGRPPIPPMGGKPSLPPTKPGPMTSAGGLKPTPGPKPPAPGTRPPATGPRPPQATVKPVIGSRAGSTGMAPTGTRGPIPNALNRAVIGRRPGAAGVPGTTGPAGPTGSRPAPSRSLIGKNGVISNPQRTTRAVRVPKAHFGGEATDRSVVSGVRQAFKPGTTVAAPAKPARKHDDESPAYRPDGGDHQWTVNAKTIPTVITGGDWSTAEHDPGRVADLAPPPLRPADESSTVERLSRPGGDESRATAPDDDFRRVPRDGRGVVARPRTERYDTDDW